MTKRRTILLVALLCSASLFVPPLGAQEPVTPPARPFGVVEGHWRPAATQELGVSWDRITFDWSRFQPNGPGDFDADAVRREWLPPDADGNREIVGMIINTPAWASESGSPTAVPDGLYLPPENPENFWAVFTRQLAETYAPQGVHRWIIWDDIDIGRRDPGNTFNGSVEDYYRLIKVAHQAITAVDDEAEIYLGGLVWWHDIAFERPNYLGRLLATILDDPTAPDNGYYFDGVTLNILIQPEPINGFNSTTDAAGDIPAAARQLLDEAGLSDKHIWITELNAVPTLDPVGGMSEATVQISLEQQVDFIVQGTSLGLAAGAERIAIYKLFDSNFNPATTPPYGLVRSDNSRRPAFDAYAHVVALFADSLTATAGRSTNARLIVLRQPSQTIFVMWSAGTESVDFWIEASFEDTVQLTDAAGNPLPEPRYGVGPSETTVHVIATPIAEVDRSGNVLIGGSPRILILDTTAPRRVWASLGDATGVRIH